jgi:hypothetical protein
VGSRLDQDAFGHGTSLSASVSGHWQGGADTVLAHHSAPLYPGLPNLPRERCARSPNEFRTSSQGPPPVLRYRP